MAFTFVDGGATDRDHMRAALGDVVEDAGPRPADGTFSDAQIAAWIT